jgi:predicted short-subunit dehydrogenase-like oxidoreductase (DUF2520 family)
MNRPEISIIGAGSLGTTLTKALVEKGWPVKSVFNRTQHKAVKLAEELEISITGSFPSSLTSLGKLVFITVSDDAISNIALRLSMLSDSFEEHTIVHCSGNESAKLLQQLKQKGATVASFHPLQTFTSESSPEDFNGIYFSMQGDSQAFTVLGEIAKNLRANTFTVNESQKSHLHAAAVLASNYITTILDASVEVGSISGLPQKQVKNALLPLVETTLKNVRKQPFDQALSGPVRRGDITTVKKHIELLSGDSELQNLYCLLGLHTLKLAKKSDKLDEKTAQKLRKIFLQQTI